MWLHCLKSLLGLLLSLAVEDPRNRGQVTQCASYRVRRVVSGKHGRHPSTSDGVSTPPCDYGAWQLCKPVFVQSSRKLLNPCKETPSRSQGPSEPRRRHRCRSATMLPALRSSNKIMRRVPRCGLVFVEDPPAVFRRECGVMYPEWLFLAQARHFDGGPASPSRCSLNAS